MNGKITIDGYYRDGEYEIHTHGENPDPAALCSITYSFRHSIEVSDLLKMMRDTILRVIDAENEQKNREEIGGRINSKLARMGLPALYMDQLNVVFDEINNASESEELTE